MLNLVTQNAHFQGICFISSGQTCSLHSYYVKPILWFLKVICPLNISPSQQTLGDGSPLDCYRTDNSSSKCHQMSKIRHFRRNDFFPMDPTFLYPSIPATVSTQNRKSFKGCRGKESKDNLNEVSCKKTCGHIWILIIKQVQHTTIHFPKEIHLFIFFLK